MAGGGGPVSTCMSNSNTAGECPVSTSCPFSPNQVCCINGECVPRGTGVGVGSELGSGCS